MNFTISSYTSLVMGTFGYAVSQQVFANSHVKQPGVNGWIYAPLFCQSAFIHSDMIPDMVIILLVVS
ncbi:hypothetical protein DASC09_028030 [Saccharomycopsis crataegensis]|uniref:Uncharacterized protein n=1 Tax=Saccharomycopsis crataegensis TaxID=43959 RepID=A0AAV5QKS7_9ASCO|nr:hypothetical protein DASC09_028030 [Saccharomycopsis crataegensis]